MTTSELFSGHASQLNELSNAGQLVQACPEGFRQKNSWSEAVTRLNHGLADLDTDQWAWKSRDLKIQQRQLTCLKLLNNTFGPPRDDILAVACWMLSEMLAEASTP
jgi:hypothetical protein